jgi:hypothetical protein
MTNEKLATEDVAMQTRCVHCKKEQYTPKVYPISLGTEGCAWCGKKSSPMSEPEYYKLLKTKRDDDSK